MKKTILFLLVAVLSVATMSAQETKKAKYVIDGKQVENFDGSQLTGKIILSYNVDDKENIHSITTSDITKAKDITVLSAKDTYGIKTTTTSSGVKTEVITADKEGDVVYVVDGKIVPYSEIKDMVSSNVVSMQVIKKKTNADYIKYAKAIIEQGGVEPKAIIKISTGSINYQKAQKP